MSEDKNPVNKNKLNVLQKLQQVENIRTTTNSIVPNQT